MINIILRISQPFILPIQTDSNNTLSIIITKQKLINQIIDHWRPSQSIPVTPLEAELRVEIHLRNKLTTDQQIIPAWIPSRWRPNQETGSRNEATTCGPGCQKQSWSKDQRSYLPWYNIAFPHRQGWHNNEQGDTEFVDDAHSQASRDLSRCASMPSNPCTTDKVSGRRNQGNQACSRRESVACRPR